MKMKDWSTALLIISLVMTPNVWADSMAGGEDLAKKVEQLTINMEKMKTTYEAKLSQMETELNALKQTRPFPASLPQVPQLTGNQSTGGFDVDYVGRQNGPFGKGGVVAQTHSGFGTVSVGGYADIEFENFQSKHSTFDQHRFILNVGAELGERLRFYSEYEIEHGGPNAAGGGEAKVEQAWMDYLINKHINVRVGAILVPFGRYNLYHDSDLQDLTDRPLVNRDIIPTTWTESGAGLYGEFNPKIGEYEDLVVGYEFYFINGLTDGFNDTGLRGARGSIESDNNNAKSIVGRTVISPAIGQEIGLSGYWGDINGQDDSIKGVGVDFLTTWGPLEVLGEWAFFSANDLPGSDSANKFHGGYLQANYHFWFDQLNETFLGKTFQNPTFTFVNRLGYAHIDDDDGDAALNDNREVRWTIGLNYRPVESWVLKLEYQNNLTRAETLERGDSEGFLASIAMGF